MGGGDSWVIFLSPLKICDCYLLTKWNHLALSCRLQKYLFAQSLLVFMLLHKF